MSYAALWSIHSTWGTIQLHTYCLSAQSGPFLSTLWKKNELVSSFHFTKDNVLPKIVPFSCLEIMLGVGMMT
jgi:hypothetical protein